MMIPKDIRIVTIHLQLGFIGGKTELSTSALDALTALADARTYVSAQGGPVVGTPGPDAEIGRVIAAGSLTTLPAQPDGILACTSCVRECCKCELLLLLLLLLLLWGRVVIFMMMMMAAIVLKRIKMQTDRDFLACRT